MIILILIFMFDELFFNIGQFDKLYCKKKHPTIAQWKSS